MSDHRRDAEVNAKSDTLDIRAVVIRGFNPWVDFAHRNEISYTDETNNTPPTLVHRSTKLFAIA